MVGSENLALSGARESTVTDTAGDAESRDKTNLPSDPLAPTMATLGIAKVARIGRCVKAA